MKLGPLVWFILAVLVAMSISGCRPEPDQIEPDDHLAPTPVAPITTAPGLKVAFIGDSGNGENFRAVLALIRDEGADVVMHQGDFDYDLDPRGWFATIDSILGRDFPFFASVGNHDIHSWPETCGDLDGCYSTFLKERMARIGAIPDDPNLDDQMYSVDYKGLQMVFVGQERAKAGDCAYDPAGYACYIRTQLDDDSHIWKVCSWHKNQQTMQVGSNGDEMGWPVYESCREAGAIIATAHDHNYGRTKTLLSMQHPIVDTTQHPLVENIPSNPNQLRVAPGASFVVVSGLSGASMRVQNRCLPAVYPYGCSHEWASIYSEAQTGGVERFGALFIEFNVDGNPYRARGYFKNTRGEVVDVFDVTASAPEREPELRARPVGR